MSETKHTPGPWAIDDGLTTRMGGPRIIAPNSKEAIADLWETSRVGTSAEANARLIAAAPDLLHAVKCMKAAFVRHPGNPEERKDALIKAIEAIAKAEGKE